MTDTIITKDLPYSGNNIGSETCSGTAQHWEAAKRYSNAMRRLGHHTCGRSLTYSHHAVCQLGVAAAHAQCAIMEAEIQLRRDAELADEDAYHARVASHGPRPDYAESLPRSAIGRIGYAAWAANQQAAAAWVAWGKY